MNKLINKLINYVGIRKLILESSSEIGKPLVLFAAINKDAILQTQIANSQLRTVKQNGVGTEVFHQEVVRSSKSHISP